MIALHNLRIRIRSQDILRDVSLHLPAATSLSILGPSGSGKTTLLRAIAGFYRKIDSGLIYVDHKLVQNAQLTFVSPSKRGCVMLFQDIALWPHMDVEAHLQFSIRLTKRSHQTKNADLNEILKTVGLGSKRNAFPKDLSGGEKQRLALARALMARPGVLLLDEPFASLDLEQKIAMTELLKQTQQRFEFSILHVTHDPFEAIHVSTQIALLNKGQISWTGDCKAFMSATQPELQPLSKAMAFWQKRRF